MCSMYVEDTEDIAMCSMNVQDAGNTDQMVPSMVDINIEENFVDDMEKENKSQTAVESENKTMVMNSTLEQFSCNEKNENYTAIHCNTKLKKAANLLNVLQEIKSGNIESVDQAKILQKHLESSVNETVLDTLMLPSEVERVNESKLLSVLDIFKGLDLRKSDSRKQFAELLNNVCDVGDNEIENDDFLK